MKKLQVLTTFICWAIALTIYVLLAMWVGQGTFDDSTSRLAAVGGLVFWIWFCAMPIHLFDIPEAIVNALMEDD